MMNNEIIKDVEYEAFDETNDLTRNKAFLTNAMIAIAGAIGRTNVSLLVVRIDLSLKTLSNFLKMLH